MCITSCSLRQRYPLLLTATPSFSPAAEPPLFLLLTPNLLLVGQISVLLLTLLFWWRCCILLITLLQLLFVLAGENAPWLHQAVPSRKHCGCIYHCPGPRPKQVVQRTIAEALGTQATHSHVSDLLAPLRCVHTCRRSGVCFCNLL